MVNKKNLIALLIIAGILLLLFLPGFSRHQKLSAECRKLKMQIETLEKINTKLEDENYKLEHDMEYVEKTVRNKLGVVRKDEIPYKTLKQEEKDEQ
ncbi:MAG: septum formation initiator family protein [Candidatus Omnitrophica bacterium]|nr:septum formation initiator family protein [Candidatus Omnitrophota bacterium]MBU4487723.1 septum formation initiator family protein [Candidatus Omnitrophota bacterium]MCG2705263.1 septum formation initiator family protein [Candidatus Omnitrophota bacterium]